MIQGPKQGEAITANFLGELTEGVNDLKEVINGPLEINQGTEEDVEVIPDYVFTETSRQISVVQVYDQSETNYADVERIESITFQNDKGEILRLDFNN
ncbi:MAG: hypothetical protein GY938_17855 [Ketobacter sp.]|nr:hypothetical protein [Ketobacter sp.]